MTKKILLDLWYHFTKQSRKSYFEIFYTALDEFAFAINGAKQRPFSTVSNFNKKKIAGSQIWEEARLEEYSHAIFGIKLTNWQRDWAGILSWRMNHELVSHNFSENCCNTPSYYSRLMIRSFVNSLWWLNIFLSVIVIKR